MIFLQYKPVLSVEAKAIKILIIKDGSIQRIKNLYFIYLAVRKLFWDKYFSNEQLHVLKIYPIFMRYTPPLKIIIWGSPTKHQTDHLTLLRDLPASQLRLIMSKNNKLETILKINVI